MTQGPVRFFAEQARIRRQRWRVAALALLLAALLGLLASAGIGPLLVALVAIFVRLADLATSGMFAPLRGALHDFVSLALAGLGEVIDQAQQPSDFLDPALLTKLWPFGLVTLPGLLVGALAYLGLHRRIARRADDALPRRLLHAEARRGDAKEGLVLQLAEEMSIMAGIAAPRVLIVEGQGANLGIIGSDHRAWTLIVTRGFLETMPRQAARGAIAVAVARIVNGDLSVNASVSALGLTIGLIATVLDWPVSPLARARLRCLLARGSDPAEIETRLLGANDERMNEVGAVDAETLPLWRKIRGYLLAPFHIVSFAFTMLAALWSGVLVALVLGWLLRRRAHEADAAAARLIGDPDSIAAAFAELAVSGGLPEALRPWSPYFLVARRDALPKVGIGMARPTDQSGITQSSMPSFSERRARLAKLGARLESGVKPQGSAILAHALIALVVMLLLTAAVLFAFLLGVFGLFFVVSSGLIGFGAALLVL